MICCAPETLLKQHKYRCLYQLLHDDVQAGPESGGGKLAGPGEWPTDGAEAGPESRSEKLAGPGEQEDDTQYLCFSR